LEKKGRDRETEKEKEMEKEIERGEKDRKRYGCHMEIFAFLNI